MSLQLIAQVFDWASKAGTMSMQGLLVLAICVLGYVVVHLHKNHDRKLGIIQDENRKSLNEWQDRIERERSEMNIERVNRITSLMGMVKDNTTAYGKVESAIDGNVEAIKDLREFIKGQTEIITRLCSDPNIKRRK